MILDTNAISALVERNEEILRLLARETALTITLISLGEFVFGVRGSRQRDELEAWLAAFLRKVEVLVPDFGTIPHYASIRQELKQAGTPIPANDVWIAALGRQHQQGILSQDRHFDHVSGLVRIGW